MAKSGRRIILLTGAPLPESLDWREDALSASPLPLFSKSQRSRFPVATVTGAVAPQWRAVPFEQCHLPTGLTPADRIEGLLERPERSADETSFLTTSDPSIILREDDEDQDQEPQISRSSQGDVLTQYYEHSFAIHENIPPSQIVGPGTMNDASLTTDDAEYSFESSISSNLDTNAQLTYARLHAGHLSNLRDMPNAVYLQSINPQTMTVNLVVGIISISQPRTIKTRKGGRNVELVEMLVGDDTRAGFGINIWLNASHAQNANKPNEGKAGEDTLRSESLQLRPRDIVLARTVALGFFRGQVYGQSLRRGMTTLDLLYRDLDSRDDRRGAYKAHELDCENSTGPPMEKVKKVRDWIMRFVGGGATPLPMHHGIVNDKGKTHLQSLPLDTQ